MTLQEYIEQTILPQYDAFDGGHKRDHAEAVIAESLQLARAHNADEDHRASGKNPPRTIYGAIVAEADRQIFPETVIARTMAYSAKLYPDGDFETPYARSREHLLEKYAEGGYMRLWLNSERNVRSLETLRAIIRDEPRLRTLCEKWYLTMTNGASPKPPF